MSSHLSWAERQAGLADWRRRRQRQGVRSGKSGGASLPRRVPPSRSGFRETSGAFCAAWRMSPRVSRYSPRVDRVRAEADFRRAAPV